MSDLPALVTAARQDGNYDALLAALPYARFLGMRATLVEERVRVHVPFAPELIGNAGIPSLHGGVAGACLEMAALLQLLHMASGPPMPKTIDFTIDYLRQAKAEDLYAEADVQRVGRRVANVRMRAFQREREHPVVLGRGNFLLG
jgi:uncharacterized protein (TIGR00369 family)